MDSLYEYLAHSIAEAEAFLRKPENCDESFTEGYIQALKDTAKVFFPDQKELWK